MCRESVPQAWPAKNFRAQSIARRSQDFNRARMRRVKKARAGDFAIVRATRARGARISIP
jgi:hypothetical protein